MYIHLNRTAQVSNGTNDTDSIFYDSRFGRKRTLMASLLMQIIIGILVAVSPWFELFLVLRAILGFVCVSIVFSGLILCKCYQIIFHI